MTEINSNLHIDSKEALKEALDNNEELFLEAYNDNSNANTDMPVLVKISQTHVDMIVPDLGLLATHVNEDVYVLSTDRVIFSGVEFINNIRIYRIKDSQKEYLMTRLFQPEYIKPEKTIGFEYKISSETLK